MRLGVSITTNLPIFIVVPQLNCSFAPLSNGPLDGEREERVVIS